MRVKARSWKDAKLAPVDGYYDKIPRQYWKIFPLLPEAELRVLLVLVERCQNFHDPDRDKELVELDHRLLAESAGIQERTVWRAVAGLVEKGIVIKENFRGDGGQINCRYRLAKAKDKVHRADKRQPARGLAAATARTSVVDRETTAQTSVVVSDPVKGKNNRNFGRTTAQTSVVAGENPGEPARGLAAATARTSGCQRADSREVPYINKNIKKNIKKEEEGAPVFAETPGRRQSSSSISPDFVLGSEFQAKVREHPWLNLQIEWDRYSTSCFGKGRVPGKSGFKTWIEYEIERHNNRPAGSPAMPAPQGSRRFEEVFPNVTLPEEENA